MDRSNVDEKETLKVVENAFKNDSKKHEIFKEGVKNGEFYVNKQGESCWNRTLIEKLKTSENG